MNKKTTSLAEKRLMTKKAAKGKRNAERLFWNGFRPSTIQLDKHKTKCEQRVKNDLKSYTT